MRGNENWQCFSVVARDFLAAAYVRVKIASVGDIICVQAMRNPDIFNPPRIL